MNELGVPAERGGSRDPGGRGPGAVGLGVGGGLRREARGRGDAGKEE